MAIQLLKRKKLGQTPFWLEVGEVFVLDPLTEIEWIWQGHATEYLGDFSEFLNGDEENDTHYLMLAKMNEEFNQGKSRDRIFKRAKEQGVLKEESLEDCE